MSDDRGDPANTFLRELLTKRSRDVAYDINLPSVRVNVGCDSEVTTHLEDTNDVAHRTVAMLMVLCNMVVSRHLRGRGVEIPNRFHANLSGVVWDRMPLRSGQPAVDSFVLVKRFARACYAIDQWGHFGLGITDYVHFTSPMRRYADVIVHRLLAGWQISRDNLEEEICWINWRSQFNRGLQRQYTAWKICAAVAGRLADGRDVVTVWVTGVSAAGIQWYMPEYSLNGFCHVSQMLPPQRWILNEDRTELAGSAGGRIQQMVSYRAIISLVDRQWGTVAVRVHAESPS